MPILNWNRIAILLIGLFGTDQSVAFGQPKDAPVRKVQKLKDGKLTAYPELVLEYSSGKTVSPEVIGKLVSEDPTLAKGDIRRLRIEYLVQLDRAVGLDLEVVKVGFWDECFLNQFLANLESLAEAASQRFSKIRTAPSLAPILRGT